MFLTKLGDEPSDTESASIRPESAKEATLLPPIVRQLQGDPVCNYNGPPEDDREETFDEFEERIEENIYEARKALRDGQRETALYESEMRTLQFNVYQANQSTVN